MYRVGHRNGSRQLLERPLLKRHLLPSLQRRATDKNTIREASLACKRRTDPGSHRISRIMLDPETSPGCTLGLLVLSVRD